MGEAGVRALVWAGALAVALAACSGREYLAVNDDGARTALPARDTPAPKQAGLAPTAAGDRCNAKPLAYLVGKAKTEIPVPEDPSRRRVVCTTCPMTKDFREDRQTILYDSGTQMVTSVTCG